ncbi:MAG: glycine cleavage system aminomethyltransferase GcvT [Actinomycetota bacterium]
MLKLSPLDAEHRALGAKMGAFAGWDMPISYTGTVAEHMAVRENVGIFDVSHLGKLLVRGDGGDQFLDAQLSNRMIGLEQGRARYTLILDDDGGIIDDLIVYAIGPQEWLVVPNASNRDAVAARLAEHAEVLDWTTLAVQGPRAPEIVEALYPFAKGLGYMHVAREGDLVIARSGYTGERGYEVFSTAADASATWATLHEAVAAAGGMACGLAARDTLRLEMGYPLHGNDIDRSTTPDEAGLMWAVALKERDFIGADAVRAHTARKRLVGLRALDRAIPRHGYAVSRNGAKIGECTSGTFSPVLKLGIALAYVDPGSVVEGDHVTVDVRGKEAQFEVVKPPFVPSSPR